MCNALHVARDSYCELPCEGLCQKQCDMLSVYFFGLLCYTGGMNDRKEVLFVPLTFCRLIATGAVTLGLALGAVCVTGFTGVSGVACSPKKERAFVPPLPKEYKVQLDEKPGPRELGFLEVEGRLKGKMDVLRILVYEVDGKKIRLNVIVAADVKEADRIYRNLAFQKQQWAYTRKGNLIYEFGGPEDAQPHIEKALTFINEATVP